MVVFFWWCFCGDVFVVVFLWCGVVLEKYWSGALVVVFFWWCGVVLE